MQMPTSYTASATHKLVQLHYDLLGTATRDDRRSIVWFGVDHQHTYRGHYQLLASGVAANRPNDRNSGYGSFMGPENAYCRLLPYKDHYTVVNTSTFGCTFKIAAIGRWDKHYTNVGAQSLIAVIGNNVGQLGETLQITHQGDALTNMLWHGAGAVSYNNVGEQYGIAAYDLNVQRTKGIIKYYKPKTLKWHIPPGGKITFSIRQPGIKTSYYANWNDAIPPWRHGDYALMMVMEGDMAFVTGEYSNKALNWPRQYIAIQRRSFSYSVQTQRATGRMGVMTDANRRTTAIPAGAYKRANYNTEMVEEKAF